MESLWGPRAPQSTSAPISCQARSVPTTYVPDTRSTHGAPGFEDAAPRSRVREARKTGRRSLFKATFSKGKLVALLQCFHYAEITHSHAASLTPWQQREMEREGQGASLRTEVAGQSHTVRASNASTYIWGQKTGCGASCTEASYFRGSQCARGAVRRAPDGVSTTCPKPLTSPSVEEKIPIPVHMPVPTHLVHGQHCMNLN